ncbi:hypothetical protein CBM2615_B140196 [Cupriavidus taiwanensis]|uniref:Uncharacterized protein n=1 Tax=Cupriavidus taiwanensis TaxID=164546 RepID=A0A976G3L5_9BURK|nr:hypothetical protein CBM2614_B150138 [Cupriavidus taiwanensis]SOZ64359.1 hypothetical protein CBM2615_B140196 [Cupriavidus taiwanensis]SOZ68110.1 hypothetical protein CBM2613_B110196 [Cupriavidus taiwanensis]SPA07921.1 hypothetical protein CBM2625_B110196 [Cupriavidus taiwanensis]
MPTLKASNPTILAVSKKLGTITQ